MIKRLDTLEVAGPDPEASARAYAHNFDLAAELAGGSIELRIGDTTIAFVSSGAQEGSDEMGGLWLEADNLEAVAASLDRAGIGYRRLSDVGERRIVEIEGAASNFVRLRIFDRGS